MCGNNNQALATAIKKTWDSWETRRPQRERELSRVGFRLLLGGQPVSLSLLADSPGRPPGEVKTELVRMAGEGRCTLSETDDLTGIMGLSVVPAPHQLSLGGKRFFTWCALDAAAIPAALNTDATVRSFLADERREITLHFRDGKWIPENIWIQLTEPEEGTRLCSGT
ncbi:MAG: organomercurial lyase [Peptococcaceae bacterium]|nr:organomercurial lyase [Peptococcaceae bacterium]